MIGLFKYHISIVTNEEKMPRYTTYKFKVSVFKGTYMYQSAQGVIDMLDENGKSVDQKMFNDWVEIGYWIRELLKKHKKKISIYDSKDNKIGEKCGYIRKTLKGV